MTVGVRADEGMWLLPLLEKMNGKALSEAGCKLTPEQIYSINNSSLKDAVVHFGGGCTGEIISADGLLVTNHHCGYASIQGLSTPEHNYLGDGYWAMKRSEELPVKGLSVTFLKYMTDVTAEIENARAKAEKKFKKNPEKVDKALEDARQVIIDREKKLNPNCSVRVASFYNGNVFYAIVSKVYRDVRFVGTPPAAVGKFGGETDNWMWPRHTGDFSMFRVYAGPDNEPAEYSEDNVPYRPENHLKISLKGVEEGDYTMIMGYPGSTQRFQTATQLKQMIAVNRIRIDARTVRQDIMWEAMCADPAVQLKYANKYAGSANGWKKWQGEELAFEKLNIIGREEAKEAAFMEWVNADPDRAKKYGEAIGLIDKSMNDHAEASYAFTLIGESLARIELVGLASRFSSFGTDGKKADPEDLRKTVADAYRDYVEPLDRKEAAALIRFYRDHAKKENYPGSLGEGFEDFGTLDIDKYVDYLFDGSVFASEEKLLKAIEGANADETFAKDPATVLSAAIYEKFLPLYDKQISGTEDLVKGNRAFAAGLLEWEDGKPSYPDANSTMRLTYGHVLSYSPKDAVLYRHYSTLSGVMEKENPDDPEFIVPAKLKELYAAKDFGRYGKDGDVRVNFLTNNDITGGNSGSPVLNADGELIGLAFDGNWESMSSDVMFEPELQRCICVDIRYVLFCIDKLGGAGYLLNEMDLVE